MLHKGTGHVCIAGPASLAAGKLVVALFAMLVAHTVSTS